MVWQDNRNGNWDIYGFDFSSSKEFQITKDKSDQRNPSIYRNIVVWEDNRNGNCDIYGCKLLQNTTKKCSDELFEEYVKPLLIAVSAALISSAIIWTLGVMWKRHKSIENRKFGIF